MDVSKYSRASKKRWKGIPKEERSRKMSLLAKKRWAKTSPRYRKEWHNKMLRARLLKKVK